MTTPTLPTDGQSNWGDPLNAGILQVNATANSAGSAAANHASNIPADPHGDRAYSQSLVTPITTGVNGPNGYVKLNGSGQLTASLVTSIGGIFTNIYDAVAQYGAVANTGSDQTTKIQNALNAAGSAGGGIVYVGPGTFSLKNYLVMPSNVWLILSEGTTLKRISGSPTPPYLISNVQFGTSNTPSTNFKISGGSLDAVGSGLTTNCIPIFLIQGNNSVIENMIINNIFSEAAIELNGCNHVSVRDIIFDGTNNASGGSAFKPAIRINISDATTTPAGLAGSVYNDALCRNISISCCRVRSKTNTWGPYSSLIDSDKIAGGQGNHTFITVTGCTVTYVDNPTVRFSINPHGVWDQYSTSGNAVTEHSWQSLGSLAGYTVNIGRYRLTDDNCVEFDIDIGANGSNATAVSFNNAPLPPLYHPQVGRRIAMGTNRTIFAGDPWPRLFFNTSGDVQVNQAANNNANLSCNARIPLD